MEERRSPFRLGCLAGLALAAGGLAMRAWACTPALEGTRLESPRHVLTYQANPQVSSFFAIDVAACAKTGPPPKSLKIDAHMPEHRHGMNYAPKVATLAPGRWRAEGLMLHMPGKWEFVFVVDGERMAHRLELSEGIHFDEDEKRKIIAHGPWPPPARRDPSNRVSGTPAAIALGERLFFEPRLSGGGGVLCASCHVPFRAFQDGRARGIGLKEVERNTPSLFNVGLYRWYGWDGGHDSLWSQSIRPLLDPREMNADAEHVANVVRGLFAGGYKAAFGRDPPGSHEEVLVDAGKALAAFQETLVSGRTPFDRFRDAMERADVDEMKTYPLAAQRGLKIFVGKGNCSVCHFGPLFTNGEFADVGVPFFVAPGKVDPGRAHGLAVLRKSRFNLLGRYNDDAARSTATGTRHVEPQHRNFGEWRVPGLRDVARTAPYMHNGSLAALRDVVKHYSELNEERLHADGEKILRRLDLGEGEVDDLVVFLETLSPAGDR
jgi:cytochrome c peroxidase